MTQTRSERKANSERIPELDGLRGLAILLVVLCHYISNVPHGRSHSLGSMAGTFLGLGGSGVDLFFILSGFLIGGILLDSKQSPNYYPTFYLRRFHRIFPLYYSWIFIFAALSFANPQFHLQTSYWVYLTYVQNYLPQRSPMEFVWLAITWSLGVEEQFYLVAPPLVRNSQPRTLVKILAAVVTFAFLLRLFLVTVYGHADHDYWGLRAATFWMPSRADNLAVGMLAALAWRNESARVWIATHISYFKYIMAVCFAGILLTAFWMVKPNYFFSPIIGIPLLAALYLSLLIIGLADKSSLVANTFRWQPLRELGKVSYCVYIIHVAVNWTVHARVRSDLPRFDSLPSIAVTVLAFGITLLIAEASWHFFEGPLIRRGHRFSY